MFSSVILFLIRFPGNIIVCGTSRPFFIFGVPSGYMPDSKVAGSPNPGPFGITTGYRRLSRNSGAGTVEYRNPAGGKS